MKKSIIRSMSIIRSVTAISSVNIFLLIHTWAIFQSLVIMVCIPNTFTALIIGIITLYFLSTYEQVLRSITVEKSTADHILEGITLESPEKNEILLSLSESLFSFLDYLWLSHKEEIITLLIANTRHLSVPELWKIHNRAKELTKVINASIGEEYQVGQLKYTEDRIIKMILEFFEAPRIAFHGMGVNLHEVIVQANAARTQPKSKTV